jgi:hypothetical protein
MTKVEELNKRDLILADLYSRRNYMNGKYGACPIFGLSDVSKLINEKDIFFLETLQVRADSADKIIAEAEAQGKDTNDINVMKELGEEINALGTPIHRNESIMTAVFVSLRLMVFYGIAIGIWGLVFKKSILLFGLCGVVAGLIICLFSVAPVIASQRTKQRIRDMVFGAGAMWGNLGIIIGAVGLVALVIRFLIFRT